MSDMISLERELEACLRSSFPDFVRKCFSSVDPAAEFLPNFHIDLMCEYLEALYRRELGKNGLIINIPPRYMKSIVCSVAWPAWLLGHNPSEQIICASYSRDLSFEHSIHTRMIMNEAWYQKLFPRTQILKDQNEKREFKTTMQGHRQAMSVGSSITGFGGNVAILDDPVNPDQAESDQERQSALTWLKGTWASRLNNKKNGIRLLIMQRLHERDPSGYLLAEQAEDYVHLKIPAVFKEKTIFDFGSVFVVKDKGDFIHPEREGKKEIDFMRRSLGSYGFSGQYQQEPVPDGGGILKAHWWRKWPLDELPDVQYIIQSYDTAYTAAHAKNPEPSYSARTTWGIFKDERNPDDVSYKMILLECWHDRIEYPELRRNAMAAWEPYARYGGCLLIEKKASGLALVADLRQAGLPIHTYQPKPNEDKIVRAHRAAPYMESGLIYYTDKHSRYQEVIDECASFPKGAHDDYVDTVTQAINSVVNRSFLAHPANPVWEDDSDIHKPQRRRSYGT